MTTVEPGASEVFTQGLLSRPRSTAFFASSPAPTITVGFDVFVQLVIAAITTRPWSSSVSVPSSSVTVTGSALRSSTAVPPARRGLPASPLWSSAGESEAGKLSAMALS